MTSTIPANTSSYIFCDIMGVLYIMDDEEHLQNITNNTVLRGLDTLVDLEVSELDDMDLPTLNYLRDQFPELENVHDYLWFQDQARPEWKIVFHKKEVPESIRDVQKPYP